MLRSSILRTWLNTETVTRRLDSLLEVASDFDAIVLDQWGVLHDGTAPYPNAVDALTTLHAKGTRLAVLSNSGKRSAPNAKRIYDVGFPEGIFELVMTSGEALWRDVSNGTIKETLFFPIERAQGDAEHWAKGLEIDLSASPEDAEAFLLMGLPDGQSVVEWAPILSLALAHEKTVYCSNPDRASPRKGGYTVVSPGALAHAHSDEGGLVEFYGKPHRPVFTALELALGTENLLMVGDSLEHDIAGAHEAGWATALIQNGLYAADFSVGDQSVTLARLAKEKSAPMPNFRLEWLQ